MAEPSKHQRGRKARQPLWKKGMIAVLVGCGLLGLGAAVGGKHPAVATAVSMPAWWALGLGGFLMALHMATRLPFKRRSPRGAAWQPPSPSTPSSSSPSSSPPPSRESTDALKALIDELESETLGSDASWPSQQPRNTTESQVDAWSETALARLDTRQLVALCETLFAQAGFNTRTEPQGHGSTADIWLHLPDQTDAVALVHCHAGPDTLLDAAGVRAVQHRISQHRLRWGVCISLTEASTPAMAHAEPYGIHLLNAQDLWQLIGRRPPEQQAALRAAVTAPSHP